MPNQGPLEPSEEPSSSAVLERISDYHVELARRYIAAGVGAAWFADDYAGQQGPFMRPELWRRLILPPLARVLAIYREAGLPIFFHTCGQAEAFVPDLLAAGADVLNLQSDACDLPALKARYGKQIAFFGGIPSQTMLLGGPEEIRQRTRSAISTLKGDGGLVLAPDQPLAFPSENTAAFVEAARTYGKYPERG